MAHGFLLSLLHRPYCLPTVCAGHLSSSSLILISVSMALCSLCSVIRWHMVSFCLSYIVPTVSLLCVQVISHPHLSSSSLSAWRYVPSVVLYGGTWFPSVSLTSSLLSPYCVCRSSLILISVSMALCSPCSVIRWHMVSFCLSYIVPTVSLLCVQVISHPHLSS